MLVFSFQDGNVSVGSKVGRDEKWLLNEMDGSDHMGVLQYW